MGIIAANINNLKEFADLSVMLYPEHTFDEMFDLYKKSFETEKEMGFLYQKDNKFIGILHLSIRSDYVNGTDTSPIMFVEAIYVLPEYRKLGIGKGFIDYAETYAKQKGITQLASDCLVDNHASERFHKNCGFREEERVICFVKDVK